MKLFGIVFLALFVVVVTADQISWESFKQQYHKTYANATDEWEHMEIFLNNVRNITEHNALFEAEKVPNRTEINENSDVAEDSRQKRNSFGDLPVKCGRDQEKINGTCRDV